MYEYVNISKIMNTLYKLYYYSVHYTDIILLYCRDNSRSCIRWTNSYICDYCNGDCGNLYMYK